jgi:hypothetical protein
MAFDSFRRVVVVCAIAATVSLPSAKGQAGPSAAAPAPQTPRTADGHPDLTGLWIPAPNPAAANANSPLAQLAGPVIGLGQGTVGDQPAQPVNGYVESEMGARDGSVVHLEQDATLMMRGNPNKPWYKPEYWAKVRELDETGTRTGVDPGFGCRNPGVARLGAPAEILQESNRVTLLYQDSTLLAREVPTDGRPLPTPENYEGIKPMGVSSGHWEGDTLVIQTVDPTPGWLGPTGWFYSPEVKFTEKLHREGNTLTWDMTVEDPILLKPWVQPARKLVLNTAPGAILTEPDACAERDGDHIVGEGEHPVQKAN